MREIKKSVNIFSPIGHRLVFLNGAIVYGQLFMNIIS